MVACDCLRIGSVLLLIHIVASPNSDAEQLLQVKDDGPTACRRRPIMPSHAADPPDRTRPGLVVAEPRAEQSSERAFGDIRAAKPARGKRAGKA